VTAVQESNATPATPSDAEGRWRAQFRDQYDAETRKTLTRYAESRTRWLGLSGVDVDSDLAEDLLQDAIVATLDGTARWDPATVPLVVHLHAIIRSRTSKMALRGHARAVPLDALDEEALCGALEHHQTDGAPPADDQLDQRRHRDAAHDLVRVLRELARGDRDVLSLLTALKRDATTTADLRRATGLSRRQRQDAQRRLDTLVARIPLELREALGFGHRPARAAPEADSPPDAHRGGRVGASPRGGTSARPVPNRAPAGYARLGALAGAVMATATAPIGE
jgi:hypothetical protein